ncbi:MAG TPA: PD-(D/E)XK nuclease family protein [Epsilonproteobacteria bacterium]|nr:PD-(D/E)XK nuclease family protein [Campylobacterota bacterium]
MKLIVYPTQRAIRAATDTYRDKNSFLPQFIPMGEFELRCTIVPHKVQVDSYERIFLLREIIKKHQFEKLQYNLDLLHFFTQSDAIFKFFEELAWEGVDFENLRYSDTYGEFDEHLNILEALFIEYQNLLHEKGLTDRFLLPKTYTINEKFIAGFDEIEIYLEGYLNNFEFELIEKISQITRVVLYFQTSKYTKKMEQRFLDYGLTLPSDKSLKIDFSNKSILKQDPIVSDTKIDVFATQERFEQFSIAFVEIQKMVDSGIEPEKIALIVPDEEIKDALRLFDRHHNLNFVMGFDYRNEKVYKALKSLEEFWKSGDVHDYQRMIGYGYSVDRRFDCQQIVSCGEFFDFLQQGSFFEYPLEQNHNQKNEKIAQLYIRISMVFEHYNLSYKEWLHLWLHGLSSITLDDTKGGKITVIDALESRNIAFEGVVVIDFNEDIIPSIPAKDNFLNTNVREFASLPTISDKEVFQKQLYANIIQRATHVSIIYCTANGRQPSRFLYELQHQQVLHLSPSWKLLYDNDFIEAPIEDIEVSFDPFGVIWSSSRLKIFLECKRKYYYKYIKEIKQKKSQEENQGVFIHRVLERVFQEEQFFLEKENLSEKISTVLEDMLDDSPRSIYQKLVYEKMLASFVANQVAHFNNGWRVIATETKIEGTIEGLRFEGRCDRIDQESVGTYVIDYKTSKTNKENKSKNLETQTDFQMNIYKAILENKYKNLQFAYIRVFDGGYFDEVKKFEEKDKRFFDVINELLEVKSFVNAKCEDLNVCKYCEFRLMCKRGEYL